MMGPLRGSNCQIVRSKRCNFIPKRPPAPMILAVSSIYSGNRSLGCVSDKPRVLSMISKDLGVSDYWSTLQNFGLSAENCENHQICSCITDAPRYIRMKPSVRERTRLCGSLVIWVGGPQKGCFFQTPSRGVSGATEERESLDAVMFGCSSLMCVSGVLFVFVPGCPFRNLQSRVVVTISTEKRSFP